MDQRVHQEMEALVTQSLSQREEVLTVDAHAHRLLDHAGRHLEGRHLDRASPRREEDVAGHLNGHPATPRDAAVEVHTEPAECDLEVIEFAVIQHEHGRSYTHLSSFRIAGPAS